MSKDAEMVAKLNAGLAELKRKARTIYIFPSEKHVVRFSKSRFAPLLTSKQEL